MVRIPRFCVVMLAERDTGIVAGLDAYAVRAGVCRFSLRVRRRPFMQILGCAARYGAIQRANPRAIFRAA